MPAVYLAILAIFAYLWLKYSEKKEDTTRNLSGDGWTVIRSGSTIVSIPEANTRETAVIIGGMYISDEEWMFEQIPEMIKRERCIILGPWTRTVNQTIEEGVKVLNQNQRDPLFTSLSGFSAGGYRVSEWYARVSEWYATGQKMFEKIYLIDPALEMETLMRSKWGAEVVLAYGSNPMENLYSQEYSYLSDEIIRAGGVVENIEMYHYEYPSYLFQKFQFSL